MCTRLHAPLEHRFGAPSPTYNGSHGCRPASSNNGFRRHNSISFSDERQQATTTSMVDPNSTNRGDPNPSNIDANNRRTLVSIRSSNDGRRLHQTAISSGEWRGSDGMHHSPWQIR
ncbi:hypothetical protein ACLOJK_018044 [Asimina triloba]